jgi:hypothetical protein
MKAEEKYINKQVSQEESAIPVVRMKMDDWRWLVSHRIPDVDTIKKYLPWHQKR